MSRVVIKEASQNEERNGESFGGVGQPGNIREYEFFVPEAGSQAETISKPGNKNLEENQKSELADFFLND